MSTPQSARPGEVLGLEKGTAKFLKTLRGEVEPHLKTHWSTRKPARIQPDEVFYDSRMDHFFEQRDVKIVVTAVNEEGQTCTCTYRPNDTHLLCAVSVANNQ
jgi:hypothetical protein